MTMHISIPISVNTDVVPVEVASALAQRAIDAELALSTAIDEGCEIISDTIGGSDGIVFHCLVLRRPQIMFDFSGIAAHFPEPPPPPADPGYTILVKP